MPKTFLTEMHPHTKFQDNKQGRWQIFKAKKAYLQKNVFGGWNSKKTVLSSNAKIPILASQKIEIYGFLDGFVL